MPHLSCRILGGLPVELRYSIAPRDPDVGIFHPYVDEYEIIAIGNKSCRRSPAWLYRRIDSTPGEDERIREMIMQDAAEAAYDY
jgi:hypothetical protein